MESFQTFKNIFIKCVSTKDNQNLIDLLRNGRQYFQNMSEDDSESILQSLFDQNDGLLRFLNDEINKQTSTRDSDSAVKEAFHLLEFIMVQFPYSHCCRYILDTKDTCKAVLIARKTALVRRTACSMFKQLIERYHNEDMELGETVKEFVSKFRILNDKERSLLYSVLSTIAKYRQDIPEIQQHSDVILTWLKNDLMDKYKPHASDLPAEIEVYLEAFTDILSTFAPTSTSHSFYKELYLCIKDLSAPEKYIHRKTKMRAAIHLLTQHMHLFQRFVYKDYETCYNLFEKISCMGGENGQYGRSALKKFYRTIANVLQHMDAEDGKKVFEYFQSRLRVQMANSTPDSNELHLTVYGFSQLAAPCKRFLTDHDVTEMYSLIARCAVPLCFRSHSTQTYINVCDYQEALSHIISYTSDLSIEHVSVLIQLSTFLIKEFPCVPETARSIPVSSLKKTIDKLNIQSKSLLEEYLHNVVYDGIVWSCSHDLLVDVELLREEGERPTCYKNYLPLWSNLVKSTGSLFFVKLMHMCTIIIHKLDLNTRTKEGNVLCNVALSQTAINPADFRIFVNLVDLYVDIINEVDDSLIESCHFTMHSFLHQIIRMSYNYPLISGFYKLVHATLKKFRNLVDDKDTETSDIVHNYLSNTADRISAFSNELLSACLYLILEMPVRYARDLLERTTAVFKIAFSMGLTDFHLARTTLKALEEWTHNLDISQTKNFLQEVVPYLDPYLQSKESSTELLQDIIKGRKKVVKNVTLVDRENSLKNFQRDILLFLGSLDSEVILNFVHKAALDTHATWDRKDLLKYTLPYPDLQTDIFFDKILHRLITLAESSSDRRTKLNASEVLHALVTFVIGKTPQQCGTNLDSFSVLYKTLCPALLNLGCDPDEITRQLFQPLTLQLAHWLSSRIGQKYISADYLIDPIYEGLCSANNAELRDFSGSCLAEFTEWSQKELDSRTFRHNIEKVMSKLTNFALHPLTRKRVAAAVAFNHLYRVLREIDEVVMVYWLELLYCFVKSLDGCDDPSIHSAIDHVQRVIEESVGVFDEGYTDRRKPAEFEGDTLKDAINWLFTQCGTLDENCRLKCMRLYEKICGSCDEYDSEKTAVKCYIDEHGIDAFNQIIFAGFKKKITIDIQTMLAFLKTFNCYTWLIKNKLIDPLKYLFSDMNPEKDTIFSNAKDLVHLLVTVKMDADNDVTALLEFSKLHSLQCKTTLKMFEFLCTLLNLDGNVIPAFFLNTELYRLISKCIMCPQTIGFDGRNFGITEALPTCIEEVLVSIKAKFNDILPMELGNEIMNIIQIYDSDILNFDEIAGNDERCYELSQFVKGLIILDRQQLLIKLCGEENSLQNAQHNIAQIFKYLQRVHIGQLVCTTIHPIFMTYLTNLMQLQLMHYKESLMEQIMHLMSNNTELLELRNYEITNLRNQDTVNKRSSEFIKHGEYFLNTFKDVIYRYMLKDIEKSLTALLGSSHATPILFSTVEDLLLFARQSRKELTLTQHCVEHLVTAIFNKFSDFERAILGDKRKKQILINIYGIAVNLTSKPTDIKSKYSHFYSWILKELTGTIDIEYKTRILKTFLICLTDMTTDDDPQLVAVLRTLRSDKYATSSNNSPEESMYSLKEINCFETLVMLLPITKSVALFEAAIYFAAGAGEHFFNEELKDYLEKYFKSIPSNCVLSSLDVAYKLFMESGVSKSYRFDVLKEFLLSAFEHCSSADAELFFERKIRDIYMIIGQSLVGNNSDIEHLAISKIGCYELIGVMFSKVPVEKIEDSGSSISRNVFGDVEPRKRLMRELYLAAIRVRELKTTNPEHKEIMRLLHCSAYNCSIAIVCLKCEESSYEGVFAENIKKEQFIWENIVDCSKKYNLQQTVDEYPKYRKRSINIRKSLNSTGTRLHYSSFMHSYSLSTSTLSEDMNIYDYNRVNLISPIEQSFVGERMTLLFECDDFNDHECMHSICGVLKHMVENNIVTTPSENVNDPPMWLKRFRASMLATRQDNVRLFLLKIILNVQSLFKEFAAFLLAPIVHIAISYLKNKPLNYIITDVVLVLIDWRTKALPEAENDKLLAQNLFEIIVDKVVNDRSMNAGRDIYKYNFSLIRMLLETWQPYLNIPKNLNEKMKTASISSVHLILICLINNMVDRILQREEIVKFLQQSIKNWKDDVEKVLQSCEALGLILNNLADDNPMRLEIIECIRNVLREMQSKNESLQVKCIRAVSKNYHAAACEYSDFTQLNISHVDLPTKADCLEMFMLRIPTLSGEEIVKELGYMKFQMILENKTSCCELVALRIVRALVLKLSPPDFLSLAKFVPPYLKNQSLEYREVTYEIFMNVFKRYTNDVTDDENAKTLLHMSTQVLLAGMLDAASSLEEKLLHFWNEEAGLAEKSKDRLLQILRMHTAEVDNVFLQFVVLSMLNLCSKTPQYLKKMFEPLYNCEYRDQKIEERWRARSLKSTAPLFVPSLASQINQTFTQLGTSLSMSVSPHLQSKSLLSLHDYNMLYATQERKFKPTFDETAVTDSSFDDQVYDEEFKVPKVPEPAHNKRSKRFLTNKKKVSDYMRDIQIKKNIQHREMIKEETVRQRDSAKLYRSYRIGDFPDIEITHCSVIKPLQELIKKHELICKDIAVVIICSLIKEVTENEESKDFSVNVIEALKNILQNCQKSSSIAAAILEILFETEKIDDTHILQCPPDIIVNAAKTNGLHFLGALVLEQRLIYGGIKLEPPMKKPRTDDLSSRQISEWIQLASLYQSMNEVDIVLSIFRDHVHNEDLKKSSLAVAAGDWSAGKHAYVRAYESETDLIKEHCLQGLFECLSHLSSWSEMGERIDNKLNNNADNIWNDPWKDWLFPWMFKSCIHVYLEENTLITSFTEALQSWFEDKEKFRYIKRLFGEELAMLLIQSGDQEINVRDALTSTLDSVQEEWIALSSHMHLRMSKLEKLRSIHEINIYMKALKSLKSSKPVAGIKNVQKFWTNSIPSIQDNLLMWNKLIMYRESFNSLLRENIDDNEESQSIEQNEIVSQMESTCLKLRLQVFDIGWHQKNTVITKKHLHKLQDKFEDTESYYGHKLLVNKAKLECLLGNLEQNAKKRLSHYATAWKYLHDCFDKDLDPALRTDVRVNISSIASLLYDESENDAQFIELLKRNTVIIEKISASSNDYNGIRNALVAYSLNNIKQHCISTESDAGECYFKLSKYCYNRLAKQGKNIGLFREFVNFTLKAMAHGSLKHAHYFPCLLKDEYLCDDDTKEIFTKLSGSIHTWLFLNWQAQLFSHLATPISALVIPIIEKLVETYPNAAIYTYRLTLETYPALIDDIRLYRIRRILYENVDVDRFLIAVKYVVQPETYLAYYLKQYLRDMAARVATPADTLMNRVMISEQKDIHDPKPGCNFFTFIRQYKNAIKNLQGKSLDNIKNDCQKMIHRIEESLNKKKKFSTRLEDYSPWLHTYAGTTLEVPGQYTGNKIPLPQYHVKIKKIESDVKVIQSLRRPIRITIIGDDARPYNFLIKFGEDLRLDQRFQQLFEIINRTLRTDVACSQRRLSIDTYQVIPLSQSLGLIQWVDNTRSLEEFIRFTFSQKEKTTYESASEEYFKWIMKAAPHVKNNGEAYRQALLNYDVAIVTDTLKKIENRFEWDCLRRSFLTLSPSLESFVSLRRNFVTTYATMCIAHWIVGVGDRNLNNTLISVGSGRCLGIDFGFAFDAGVCVAVPELMPFRLTHQILGLLRPFTERDLLSATMVHVLRALRDDDGPIIACLDVFINEPLNWSGPVKKYSDYDEDDFLEVKWLSEKKINIVRKKLDGNKPSMIVIEQLKYIHSDQYFDRYQKVLNGTENNRVRAELDDNCLTPEKQVECLLDQATDYNILGRTYHGWKPWL